jgi:hypothetical protein
MPWLDSFGSPTAEFAVLVTLLIVGAALGFARSARIRARVLVLAERVDLRDLVLVLGAWILVLTLAGSRLAGPPVWVLDLEVELNVPTATSALLLLAAASLAWLLADHGRGRRRHVIAARALALFFVFIAIDEAASLHERPELWTGVAWQYLYLPVILGGAVAWLFAAPLVRAGPARAAFAAAPAAWLAAPVLDKLEFTGPIGSQTPVGSYEFLAGAEEVLEMTGSVLFVLALLVSLRAIKQRTADEGELPAAATSARGQAAGKLALVALGSALALASLLADLVGVSESGFSDKQILLLSTGIALVALGLILLVSARREVHHGTPTLRVAKRSGVD